MDQQNLYELSAAADGPRRDFAPALLARDRYVIDDLLRMASGRSLRLVELSVGDGRTTLAMLSGIPHAHLTCAEISELRIEQLRTEIAADPSLSGRMPEFVACNLDTEFARFAADSYDAVVALDIMEHVLDVFGFVANCRRILKPGGRLYLRVPNIAYLKHRLDLLRGRLPVTASWFGPNGDLSAWRDKHGWDGGHLHLFTVPMLSQLLREADFEVASCNDAGARLAGLRSLWPESPVCQPSDHCECRVT